jgi:diguanylate cyclase (GGDEF)-like protein
LRGRKVLKEVARAIKKEIKDAYSIARYGGDEFVIVLPDTELEVAMAVAEKIRLRIKEETFLEEENLNIQLTASFGVACFPHNAESKDDLINIADTAMFSAKRNNRDTVYMAETKILPREKV